MEDFEEEMTRSDMLLEIGRLRDRVDRLSNENHELIACIIDVLEADGDLAVMDFARYRAALNKIEVQAKK